MTIANNQSFGWFSGILPYQIIDWLSAKNTIDVHAFNEEAFRSSCEYGHIDIAKWLVSEHNVNVHAVDDDAFMEACLKGHIQIAKWLVTEHNVDVHARNEYMFRTVCRRQQINMIEMFTQDLNHNEFKYAYHNGTAYLINHSWMNNWSSCVVSGCPIAYIGSFDKDKIVELMAAN